MPAGPGGRPPGLPQSPCPAPPHASHAQAQGARGALSPAARRPAPLPAGQRRGAAPRDARGGPRRDCGARTPGACELRGLSNACGDWKVLSALFSFQSQHSSYLRRANARLTTSSKPRRRRQRRRENARLTTSSESAGTLRQRRCCWPTTSAARSPGRRPSSARRPRPVTQLTIKGGAGSVSEECQTAWTARRL